MLGADIGMVHLQGLTQRQLQDLLGPRGEGDMTGRLGLPMTDDLFHLFAYGLQRDAHLLKGFCRDALTLMDQPEQDVLGADVVVVEHLGLILGQHHHAAGTISKTLEHSTPLFSPGRLAAADRSGIKSSDPFQSNRSSGVRRTRSTPPGGETSESVLDRCPPANGHAQHRVFARQPAGINRYDSIGGARGRWHRGGRQSLSTGRRRPVPGR